MKKYILSAVAAITLLSACNNNTSNNEKDSDTSGVAITPADKGPDFPDATLQVQSLTGKMKGTDSVELTINYSVSGYDLKAQTEGAATCECANSEEGQHIHFILDNAPYQALYTPTNTFTVAAGSEHVLMSFLSRSYHLSLKNPKAGVLYKFSVDANGKVTKLDNPSEPMLFYSRPKGDYEGEDTKNILLDFYVINTDLSPNGSKVKASINGDKDLIIDSWQPYTISDLPMGKNTVTLTLLDNDEKELNGKFSTVSRDFNLKAGKTDE